MSFSSEIKKELCNIPLEEEHCIKAELHAMNPGWEGETPIYVLNRQAALKAALPALNNDEKLRLNRKCCKRAYIRGSFIANGSCANPHKTYHMEFSPGSPDYIDEFKRAMLKFGLKLKETMRRQQSLLYLKESAQIAEVLHIIGAHKALMQYEDVRILKEINNKVNRWVNSETANLKKTVSAAYRQKIEIEFIKKKTGLGYMPEPLKIVANLRLNNPEATLEEIGQMLSPPIGKSGVNHRLRKISAIAEALRDS